MVRCPCCSPLLTHPTMHITAHPSQKFGEIEHFIWENLEWQGLQFKMIMVLKAIPTTGTHRHPAWEYPLLLWSWELVESICLLWVSTDQQTTNVNMVGLQLDKTVPFGKYLPCSARRIERLVQLYDVYRGSTYVMCCPSFFLWCLWWNLFCLSALRCKSWV